MSLSKYEGSAEISPCCAYRYRLERRFMAGNGESVNFIMLNPSTADDREDDPTVRRCIGFATDWGYSRLIVTNIFALRSTDPSVLNGHRDPVGVANNAAIFKAAEDCSLLVAAWGAHGKLRDRALTVRAILSNAGFELNALRLTSAGEPCHPLYLPAALTPFRLSASVGKLF